MLIVSGGSERAGRPCNPTSSVMGAPGCVQAPPCLALPQALDPPPQTLGVLHSPAQGPALHPQHLRNVVCCVTRLPVCLLCCCCC